MRPGGFAAFETCSNRFTAFFAWQNDCDYRQCTHIKLPFSGRIGWLVD
jgi:putative ribosome biogenesis GTPase RsgA